MPNIFKSVYKWVKKKIKPSKPRPRYIKMYVLVREDMLPINRSVQAGHAVAEYLLSHKPEVIENGKLTTWTNGYLIYLGVPNEIELMKWSTELKRNGRVCSVFYEPDWGERPEATALACVSFGDEFKGLPLLTLE